MKKIIITALLLVLSQKSFTAEADNFTARQLNLLDASSQVNELANNYLKKLIENLESLGCNEKSLYIELRKIFANHSSGEITKDILYKKIVPIYALSIKKSVYQSWEISDGYILGNKKAATSPLALSPLIQIGDQIVGVDKFEHMFGMGYDYFKKYYIKHGNLKLILNYGVALEKTILGGNIFATGVFSYGDLSANFNGMRFWNHVLQKNDDILGIEYNLGPYVVCRDNKWAVNERNPIDFRNYIDASMDESINCSKFAGTKAVIKFKSELTKRGFINSDGEATCPVEPEKLAEMRAKYQKSGVINKILNSDGIQKVNYFKKL